MPDLLPITLEDQILCVEREIAMRERVYPKWVESGKMSQKTADYEIATMRAITETLRVAIVRARG